MREQRVKRGRNTTNKSRKERRKWKKKGKIVERNNSKDKIEIGRRRRDYSGSIIK